MTTPIIHEKATITEEMRYRERLCLYALKHGVTRAARRYRTNQESLPFHFWVQLLFQCFGIRKLTACLA